MLKMHTYMYPPYVHWITGRDVIIPRIVVTNRPTERLFSKGVHALLAENGHSTPRKYINVMFSC